MNKIVVLFVSLLVCIPALQAMPRSGFMDEYESLSELRPGRWQFKNPRFNLAEYQQVYIAPMLLWYHPDNSYQGIDPAQLNAISQSFNKAITKQLSTAVSVVDEPSGANTLYIRIALTHLKVQKKKKNLLSYTPIGIVKGTLMAALGKNIELTDAVFEVEIFDAESEVRLFAMVDHRPNKKATNTSPPKDYKSTWARLQKIAEMGAQRLKHALTAPVVVE